MAAGPDPAIGYPRQCANDAAPVSNHPSGRRNYAASSRISSPAPDRRCGADCAAPRAFPSPARPCGRSARVRHSPRRRLRGMPSPAMKASSTSAASSPGCPIAAATSAWRSAFDRLVPAHHRRQHDAGRVAVRDVEHRAEHIADAVARAHRHAARRAAPSTATNPSGNPSRACRSAGSAFTRGSPRVSSARPRSACASA